MNNDESTVEDSIDTLIDEDVKQSKETEESTMGSSKVKPSLVKHKIAISDEAYKFLISTNLNITSFSTKIDMLIHKAKQFDSIKGTQIHVQRRNLKSPVQKLGGKKE